MDEFLGCSDNGFDGSHFALTLEVVGETFVARYEIGRAAQTIIVCNWIIEDMTEMSTANYRKIMKEIFHVQ